MVRRTASLSISAKGKTRASARAKVVLPVPGRPESRMRAGACGGKLPLGIGCATFIDVHTIGKGRRKKKVADKRAQRRTDQGLCRPWDGYGFSGSSGCGPDGTDQVPDDPPEGKQARLPHAPWIAQACWPAAPPAPLSQPSRRQSLSRLDRKAWPPQVSGGLCSSRAVLRTTTPM